MAERRTVELLLQIKQSGQETVKQLGAMLKDLASPVQQSQKAFEGFAAATQRNVTSVNTKLEQFRKELKSGELAARTMSAGVQASLRGVQVAAEAAWGSITFGVSLVVKAVTSLLGFLNPFSLQGLLTGAALGGSGLLAKEWIEAADNAETYRKRLGTLIDDQKVANRIFSEFEELSQRSGIDAETQAEAFARLFNFRVKDAEASVKALVGVAANLKINLLDIVQAIETPNQKGLKQLGIDMNKLGNQVQLLSGNFNIVVANTEDAIRQGVIDLLTQKFPDALENAQLTFATQMAILRANLGQFAQDFGAILLPEAVRVLKMVNDWLEKNRATIVAIVRSIPEIARIVADEIDALFSSGKALERLAPLVAVVLEAGERAFVGLLQIVLEGLRVISVPVRGFVKLLFDEIAAIAEAMILNIVPRIGNAVARAMNPSIKKVMEDLAKEQAREAELSATILKLGPDSSAASRKIRELEDVQRRIENLTKRLKKELAPAFDVVSVEAIAKTFKDKQENNLKDSYSGVKEAAGNFKVVAEDLARDMGKKFSAVGAIFNITFTGMLQRITDAVANKAAQLRAADAASQSAGKASLKPLKADPDDVFRVSQLLRNDYDAQIAEAKRAYEAELVILREKFKDREKATRYIIDLETGLRRQLQEKVSEIEDAKRIAALEAQAAALEGLERTIKLNEIAYQKDLVNFRKYQRQGLIDDAGAAEAERLARLRRDRANLQAAIELRNEITNAMLTGVRREEAEAAQSYSRDVLKWQQALEDKKISFEQYQQILTNLQTAFEERRYQIELRRRDAQNQLQMLSLQVAGRTRDAELLQITIDGQKALETYRQLRQQDLISEEQYEGAKTLLRQQAEQKRLEITGNAFQGMQQGLRNFGSSMVTEFRFGMQLSQQFADSISNGFGQAFADAITGAKSFGDAMRSVIASVLADLAKMAAVQAFRNFFGTILGGSGGIFSGIAGLFGGYNEGGLVPGGGPNRDSILAGLTPGEFVVRRDAVQAPGILPLLQAINRSVPRMPATPTFAGVPAFNGGGLVPKGGGEQVVRAIVSIGDDEIERISQHPKMRAGVRREVSQNRDSLGGA